MRKLYLNEDTSMLPAVFVYAWIRDKSGTRQCLNFPTFPDERGDEFCKNLEKDETFMGWVRNPWTGEVLLSDEEKDAFRDEYRDFALKVSKLR